MQEEPKQPGPPPSEAAVDLVERASDPFGIVRVFIYVTFGITGVAGVATSLLQMGDDAGAAMTNLGIGFAVFCKDHDLGLTLVSSKGVSHPSRTN